jgi:type IV pilus assembly protein PilP
MKVFQNLKRNKIVIGLVFLFSFLLLIGCGGGTSPSSLLQKGKAPSIEKKKSEPVTMAEKKEPEKKEEAEYTYNSAGKADPFKPFIQLTPVRELSRTAPLTPLQKYEISQLKLVAIISSPQGNVGLVEDSTGKGYFLKKGIGIGKNDGKVTKILRDKVIIEEVYQDVLGQTKINEIPLLLHRLEEGGET